MIVDVFCGTGAIGEAALRCGRAYVGVDTDDEAVAQTKIRLERVRRELAEDGLHPDETGHGQVMRLYVVGDHIHPTEKVSIFMSRV